jgi:hypothetical protein
VIAPRDFIFSSDNGPGARGELNVLRRAAPAELGASIGCIWLPAMPEDLTVWHGRLLLIFEGGAQRYSQDRPANRIDDVHVGSLSALLAVTDPPVAPAQNRAVRS